MTSPSPAPPATDLTVGMSLLTQAPDQYTGTATYIRALLHEFSQPSAGVVVHALCNEYAFEAFRDCAGPGVRLTLARRHRVGRTRVGRAGTLLRILARPAPLTRQFESDVSVVHYPLTLGCPRTDRATVLTLHDVQHRDLPGNFSAAQHVVRRLLYDRQARAATIVTTLSDYTRSRIIETLDIDPERIVAIPHGVDHQRFSVDPATGDEEMAVRLDLPARFLFYPASLWPHKCHLALVEALARVPEDDVQLLLCGATVGRLEAVMAAAEASGIRHRVRHLGLVPAAALPVLYRRATALVFPSAYEGFGLPPLEAMACGCPVASALTGPLVEVCGKAAARLDPADPDQMAGVIATIIADVDVRQRLRSAGLAQSDKFSWRAVAGAHVAAYRRARDLHSKTGH